MSDDAPRPDLVLTRTSRKILNEFQHMEGRLPDHAAALIGRMRMRPVEPTIDTEPPDLTTIDPDPAHMQRLKVTEEPRDMERPDRVHDDLEHCTPQFILRNTWRAEKYGDPDSLDFEYKSVGAEALGDYLEDARKCRFTRGDRTPTLTSDEMRVSVALRRVLMVETRWNSIFGRAEPAAEPVDPDPESSV